MLAQNFKTPAELNISKREFDAIVTTLGAFERNEIQYVTSDEETTQQILAAFNMDYWDGKEATGGYENCGAVHCIGGWVTKLTGVNLPEKDGEEWDAELAGREGLYNLFYPHQIRDWSRITVAKAAEAIRNYLTTGKPNWEEVVGES
jgi:hypothetical protein